MVAAVAFLQNVGGYKGCDCSTCNSVVDSSKTSAAILEPHIQTLIEQAGERGIPENVFDPEGTPVKLPPHEIKAAVYSMLGKYLTSLEEEKE